MKKPDAISILPFAKFKKIIYPLPVNMLLYVGPATNTVLKRLGIQTIGELAHYDKRKLSQYLGKMGILIQNYANGNDEEEVKRYIDRVRPKSISRGMTFVQDIEEQMVLETYIKILADEVAFQLRKEYLHCTTVGLTIKDADFYVISRQKKVSRTDMYQVIAQMAIQLLHENRIKNTKIRSLTVSSSNLVSVRNEQLSIFSLLSQKEEHFKMEEINKTMDEVKERFGYHKITFASLMKQNTIVTN